MSTPIVPGYIDGPTPHSLADLWQRPSDDFPDELWPIDVLESVIPEPSGWLTVCAHQSTEQVSGGAGCVLAQRSGVPNSLATTAWSGRGLGQFSVWESPEGLSGFEDGLRASDSDTQLEFFAHVRRPAGSPDPVVEVSHPFLWYFDAYPVRDGWAYVDGAGRPQELVRWQIGREHWNVQVKALEFRHFLHRCGVDALLQFDYSKRTTTGGFTRVDNDYRCDWAHFDFVATAEGAGPRGGLSRLIGQYVVRGNRTSRGPRFEEWSREVDYPSFTYSVDASTGEPISHTCDPDQLGTYFDADGSRLHYLTPVYFRREVLIPYAEEPRRYQLSRSRLECLGLWGLDISFNTADLVEVYLGDLGRDLPPAEWGHWLSNNVLPAGTMEEGRFRRDFLGQFENSPDVPGELRRARVAASEATTRLFGTPVWRPIDDDTAPQYESMIGPLTEDPAALHGPVILLAKCFVDAIDPTPLKAFLGDAESGERSLSLLGRAVERLGGSVDDVEALRALYDVRSAGGFAHLGGSRSAAAFERLGIAGLSTIEGFDLAANRIIDCLRRVTDLVEAQIESGTATPVERSEFEGPAG